MGMEMEMKMEMEMERRTDCGFGDRVGALNKLGSGDVKWNWRWRWNIVGDGVLNRLEDGFWK